MSNGILTRPTQPMLCRVGKERITKGKNLSDPVVYEG